MADHKIEGLPRLISVSQAAGVLGVSVQTVRSMIATGRLPAIKLGESSTRVRECDVVALVKGGVK